ncbi:glycosyl hydrolase [Paenibacillus puerhi]|uniref:glycosyl hydrolase n=1 Tax=Paenibacillus puerhi TaxID=2692622 RepID=UPI001356E8FB|nr:glycosyl hydrolase [Paenibacillus puerhi]
MLHRLKKKISSITILVSLVSLLVPLGPFSTAHASVTARTLDPNADFIVKAQDAVVQGFGVEKRGATPEDDDTLYDGAGYVSFFYTHDESQPEGTATFTVNVPEGGLYNLSLGYYLPTGYGNKNAGLQVNGAGSGEVTLEAPAEGNVRAEKLAGKVLLNAGNNEVTVLRGWGYYGIEYVQVVPAAPPVTSSKLEAENGIMTGSVSIDSSGTGYSGDGYASFKNDGSLTLTYHAATAGMYDIAISYSAPSGDKKTHLIIGGATSEISLPSASHFVEISGGKAMLQAGANSIVIKANWGWYHIDYVTLSAAVATDGHDVTSSLINPNATMETRALMNYLVSQYGQKIISGQQELSSVEWIYQQTGKLPAIFSTDLMDYSPSRVQYGATSNEVEKMINWFQNGGIVALCWHWNAPAGLYNEPEKEWWRGFYTDSTSFDVKYALDNPDSEDNKLLMRDIDAIAIQLKRLQDAGVPILWRPLHEAEGGWFWWGAKGPEATKQLWRLMYDRLTNYHGLNNLIWVWNSEKADWYPGNDVVDIASIDIYNPAGDYNPIIANFDNLVSLVKDKKIIGLAENGPIPDPDLLQTYGADWSFFNTWTGNFINDGVVNTTAHLNKVYNHDYIITLDELPSDLYTSFRYEAEKGELTGLVVASEPNGYSGKGYVTGFDAAGDNLHIEADVTAGDYTITIRYRTLGGDKTNNITINDDLVSEQVFEDSTQWNDAVLGPYKFQNGINTIDITNNWGWMDIDSIKLDAAAVPPVSQTSTTVSALLGTILWLLISISLHI